MREGKDAGVWACSGPTRRARTRLADRLLQALRRRVGRAERVHGHEKEVWDIHGAGGKIAADLGGEVILELGVHQLGDVTMSQLRPAPRSAAHEQREGGCTSAQATLAL